ncbi:MAG: hypothetical protein U9P44_03065 [archaeon]|nr:hypothetical protein [archaeon]
MIDMRQLRLLCIGFIFILALVAVGYAFPQMPHDIYGTVTIDGTPAPAGTIITAMNSDNVTCGSFTVKTEGIYGFLHISNEENDAVITFNIGDILAEETLIWNSGDKTELNLTEVSKNTVGETQDNGKTTSGSSSGSSSSSVPVCGDGICTYQLESCGKPYYCPEDCEKCDDEKCTEQWVCTEWSEPVDGLQSRTCTDSNNCGTVADRPAETQELACKEHWVCNEWSSCINEIQVRRCIDTNSCGTEYDIPSESRSCPVMEEQSVKRTHNAAGSFSFLPTGLASLTTVAEPKNLAKIGMLLIAALLILFYLKKKKKAPKKKKVYSFSY